MKNTKRTILFTNKDDIERSYIIDQEIEYKHVQKFKIVEQISGIQTRIFRSYIVDENKELISLDEFKERKLNYGYIEIPTDEWYYKEEIGVINRSRFKQVKSYNYRHCIKHYTKLFESVVYIDFLGNEIDDFSLKNYIEFKEYEIEYKELILESLFSMYISNRESLGIDWDNETLNHFYPELKNKYELLELIRPWSINFRNKESYDHELSDKALFEIRGECNWDEEHGFELIFKSRDEILCH